jgi:hypothetical protein
VSYNSYMQVSHTQIPQLNEDKASLFQKAWNRLESGGTSEVELDAMNAATCADYMVSLVDDESEFRCIYGRGEGARVAYADAAAYVNKYHKRGS